MAFAYTHNQQSELIVSIRDSCEYRNKSFAERGTYTKSHSFSIPMQLLAKSIRIHPFLILLQTHSIMLGFASYNLITNSLGLTSLSFLYEKKLFFLFFFLKSKAQKKFMEYFTFSNHCIYLMDFLVAILIHSLFVGSLNKRALLSHHIAIQERSITRDKANYDLIELTQLCLAHLYIKKI